VVRLKGKEGLFLARRKKEEEEGSRGEEEKKIIRLLGDEESGLDRRILQKKKRLNILSLKIQKGG